MADCLRSWVRSTPLERPLADLRAIQTSTGHTLEQVAEDVRLLYQLSVHMRKRRFDNGVLSVQKPKLSFVLGA